MESPFSKSVLRLAAHPRVILAFLALLIALSRLHTYAEPLEMDGATYAVIAREVRAGRNLYTDLWDHKPPAIYLSYLAAQVVAGDGAAHVYLLGLVLAVTTLLGVYYAASQLGGSAVGLAAAAFWAVVSGDLALQANQPNTEAFINAYLVWAFALLLARDSLGRGRLLGLALLVAAGSFYKQIAIPVGAALLAAHVFTTRDRARTLLDAATVFGIVLMLWAGVFAYFAATGRLEAFVGAVFEFNRLYGGNVWLNFREAFRPSHLLPTCMFSVLPLVALTLFAIVEPKRTLPLRARALAVAYAVATFVGVMLPGRFFEHYYQLWLPLLAVCGAWGIVALQRAAHSSSFSFRTIAAAVATILVALQLPNYARPADAWAHWKFGDRLLESRAAAEAINRVLLPGETFYEWGHEAELYYYSGRKPPGPELRSGHLLTGPRSEERTQRLLDDLRRNRPELVVVGRAHPFPADHAVPRWIAEQYRPLPQAPCDDARPARFLFLARRGGRLEHEAQRMPCASGNAETRDQSPRPS